MFKGMPFFAALLVLLLWAAPVASKAQPASEATPTATPAATATATPFPSQDEPQETPGPSPTPTTIPGLGYDDEIRVPGEPTPTPVPGFTPPPDWKERDDDFFNKRDDQWDPKKVFPGNYYALPVTMDVGWRPCLDSNDCKAPPDGNIYKSPGQISLFAGYAFQPRATVTSPFMAGGLEWIVSETDVDGKTHSRSQFRPTWRFGYNFTAASIYASTAVILPDQERTKIGYHVGAGVSSIAILALAACSAEAIPSVLEVGWDFLENPATHRIEDEFVLKVGWGF